MSPEQIANPQNYNLYMMAVMFILLVITTYVGPGHGSRTFLMDVAAGFICWMAYSTGVYWLALVMAWICGIITYHFFRRIFDNLADK